MRNADCSQQGIFVNGKTFGEVYLESKRKKEPTLVKSFMVYNGIRGACGYYEFGDDRLSEAGKRLLGIHGEVKEE